MRTALPVVPLKVQHNNMTVLYGNLAGLEGRLRLVGRQELVG